MATLPCCCLWVLLAAGCLAMSLDHEDEDQVAEVVKRMKRNSPDRIHGHSMATLHVDDPNTGHVHRLTRRDVINHVTDPAPRSRRFSLHLAAGDKVHMHLTRRNVVTSSTRITERLAGGAEISHVAPVDCFFTGPVEGSRGHAVMSLCEGQVMGTAQTETRQYEMHLLPREVAARKRRSTDLVHVLVTWTDLENAREPEEGLHRLRKRAGKDDMFYDADAMVVEESEMDRREKDAIITDPPLRNKTDRHAIVETAAFMDTFYQDAFVNDLVFPNDTQWFIRLALLKWCGIAAVMSDPKVGWNITVRLVVLEIWRQNPDWYNNEATATLGGRMGHVCRMTHNMSFDQATVLTKAISKGRSGLAFVTGACRKNFRCTAVMPTGITFNTELHEMGHSLGLSHEPKGPCAGDESEHPGYMGGRFNFARKCYKATFDRTFLKMDCLFVEHYDSSPNQLLAPGQAPDFDGQCQFLHGQEYVYLHSATSDLPCKAYRCIAGDPTKTSFGTVYKTRVVPGTPCAPGKMCVEWGQGCLPVNETSYGQVFERNRVVNGGWSRYTNLTDCRTPTPGGASFRVATRTCTKPEPHYGAYCQGLSHKARLCQKLMTPTSGQVDMDRLGEEICSYRRENGPSKKDEQVEYTGTGTVNNRQGTVDTCLIGCRMNDVRRLSTATYVIPDGVSCAGPNDPFDDNMKGVRRFCLNGICTAFGCNDWTFDWAWSKVKDVCGVCGGSGDSCVFGEFNGPLGGGERHTLVLLPVGAEDIYIGHPFHLQRDVSIELWTKDTANSQAIVSKAQRVGFSRASLTMPVSFAGTFWYYDKNLQSLTAVGPLDQPVNIMIHKSKVNTTFRKAVYRYKSTETDSVSKCMNGGSRLAGGCACPKGYYGFMCEHTCRQFCHNGAKLDTDTCKCQCDTERETGKDCKCRAAFTGQNCKSCVPTVCNNGGVFNSNTCKCDCPLNCGGRDCSLSCEDTGNKCDWPVYLSLKCGTTDSLDEVCRRACGFCTYDPLYQNGSCTAH